MPFEHKKCFKEKILQIYSDIYKHRHAIYFFNFAIAKPEVWYWDFFELAERHKTGQFREGNETLFPKLWGQKTNEILVKGPKTCKIPMKTKKAVLERLPNRIPDMIRQFWELKTHKILVKAKRFKINDLQGLSLKQA